MATEWKEKRPFQGYLEMEGDKGLELNKESMMCPWFSACGSWRPGGSETCGDPWPVVNGKGVVSIFRHARW